ncbi:MAG: helix-turn-helix domain-containing protein [Patescibacteria group bacterium]
MDELIIGEKKYISSKQAAKMTGYAKDYIGQLCREGRVSARLVGRSWYVLESALHDHRFGEQKGASTSFSAWESPRYSTTDAEILPSVNRLQGAAPSVGEEKEEEASQRLQDTWQAWFDRFDSAAHTPIVDVKVEESDTGKEEEVSSEQGVDIAVPIHAIHNTHYQIPPAFFEESVPQRHIESTGEDKDWKTNKRERIVARGVFRTIRIAGILFACVIATLATFGSGYLDKYIISNSQVSLVAGIILYNK